MSRLHNDSKKIKACQQIERDIPNGLISQGDFYPLLEKLETLRVKLAMLYTDGKENEITDNKSNYNEAKDFILSILGFEDINLN